MTGTDNELEATSSVHETAAELQARTAILPDYALKGGEPAATRDAGAPSTRKAEEAASWPTAGAGSRLSGVVGALVTLAVAIGLGLFLRRRSAARARARD